MIGLFDADGEFVPRAVAALALFPGRQGHPPVIRPIRERGRPGVDRDVPLAPPDKIEKGPAGRFRPGRDGRAAAVSVPLAQNDVVGRQSGIAEQVGPDRDVDHEAAAPFENGLDFGGRGFPIMVVLSAQNQDADWLDRCGTGPERPRGAGRGEDEDDRRGRGPQRAERTLRRLRGGAPFSHFRG